MGLVPLKLKVAPGSTLVRLVTASSTLFAFTSLITMLKHTVPLSHTSISLLPVITALPFTLVMLPDAALGGTLLQG